MRGCGEIIVGGREDRRRGLGLINEDGRPLRGLLAAGADAGGVFYRAQGGHSATALVFGLRAVARAKRAPPS